MLDLLQFTAIGDRIGSFITLFTDVVIFVMVLVLLVVGFTWLSLVFAGMEDRINDKIKEPIWVLKNEFLRLWRLWKRINFSLKFFTGKRLISLKSIWRSFVLHIAKIPLLIIVVITFLSIPLSLVAFIYFYFSNLEKTSMHREFMRDLEVTKNFRERTGYVVYAESGRKIDFIGTDGKIHTITTAVVPCRITAHITEPETIEVCRSFTVIKGHDLSKPTLVTYHINHHL